MTGIPATTLRLPWRSLHPFRRWVDTAALASGLQMRFGEESNDMKVGIILESFVAHNFTGIYRIDNIHRTITGPLSVSLCNRQVLDFELGTMCITPPKKTRSATKRFLETPPGLHCRDSSACPNNITTACTFISAPSCDCVKS